MGNDIQQVASVGVQLQAKPAVNISAAGAQAPAHVKAEAPTPIKLSVPKAAEIRYDPNQERQELSAAIGMLNKQLESTKRGLGLSYDESKHTAVVKVTDANTGEVVRQIPTEQVLKMAHDIDRFTGMLLNKTA